MSDAPKDKAAKDQPDKNPAAKAEPTPGSDRRRRRRLLLLVAVGGAVVGGGSGAYFLHHGSEGDDDASQGSQRGQVVYPVKHKPTAPTLGIEYHFDRNALVDSRLAGSLLVGLTASGNLVTFDAESFAVRGQKVPHRRATCLGPSDASHVLVGISNGTVVRMAVDGLKFEQAATVPGVPYWLGKRRSDGALVVAYRSPSDLDGRISIELTGGRKVYTTGAHPRLALDGNDRLWIGSDGSIESLDLASGVRREFAIKDGWKGLRGFLALADGQVWAYGGTGEPGAMGSFIARLLPGAKPTLLYGLGGKRAPQGAPASPVSHIVEDIDTSPSQLIVVTNDTVLVTDHDLGAWKPLDAMAGSHRGEESISARGRTHLLKHGVVLTPSRGGFMVVTPDFTRRHVVDGQLSIPRPFHIVRLADGIAVYGDAGAQFYKGGRWHAPPESIMPPAELMGTARADEKDRQWVAMTTIPIEGEVSYVIAKAGPPRHYLGHIHGLRDVVLTARWDGRVLTVLGREDLPIEPVDTFATPDNQLWNVDDQGLWSFSGGHWRMVMRTAPELPANAKPGAKTVVTVVHSHDALKSAIGEPLHFADSPRSPFYGLPVAAPAWALVRLDSNEAGGIPLIDELPIKVDGERLMLRDLTLWGNRKEELLLATDHGLCVFNMKWGTCELKHPEGLTDEVDRFMRDGTKRLWLGGRGLWVLRDEKHADAVHPWIPMLGDTQVIAMAETPDGRLVIGTEDRGIIFLTIPEGWFQRATPPPAETPPWDATRPHEPNYLDRSVVLRECPHKPGKAADTSASLLLAELSKLIHAQGAGVRLRLEARYTGGPDIALRGEAPEKLLDGVFPILNKLGSKARFSVKKRFGPPGSEAVEVRACPE
jgi:hypothetical protein